MPPPAAPPATSTSAARRPSSAKARGARRRCSSASSPATRRTSTGRPFVGPAGRLLDKALAEAGIDRGAAYVTNVVKHFKWEPRGKRRIHAKPNALEIMACRPWLEAEIAVVKPEVLVCLGATAAQAHARAEVPGDDSSAASSCRSPLAPKVTATVHPSSILRAPDDEARRLETARFIAA